MPLGVMVAHKILVLSVRVRILERQQVMQFLHNNRGKKEKGTRNSQRVKAGLVVKQRLYKE